MCRPQTGTNQVAHKGQASEPSRCSPKTFKELPVPFLVVIGDNKGDERRKDKANRRVSAPPARKSTPHTEEFAKRPITGIQKCSKLKMTPHLNQIPQHDPKAWRFILRLLAKFHISPIVLCKHPSCTLAPFAELAPLPIWRPCRRGAFISQVRHLIAYPTTNDSTSGFGSRKPMF